MDRSLRAAPVFSSLREYRGAYLPVDLIAGLTLLAIAIPEQMATATLAGVAPVIGLYVFVAAVIGFALLGSSPQVSSGADSTIAPVMAAGIGALAVAGTSAYAELLAALAVLVGLGLLLVGVARLGWLADLLSRPVTAGFISGIAVAIAIGQLPHVLGLPGAPGSALARLAALVGHLGQISWPTLAVAAGVLAVVEGGEWLGRRLQRQVPGALVALAGSIVVSSLFDLRAHGVAVVGAFKGGLPPVTLPPFTVGEVEQLLPLAAAVIVLCVAQTAATSRTFAEAGGYEIDVNRDFLGLGAGSVFAGLVGGFAVDASPPRTAVVAQAGGRSQLGALFAAGLTLLLVLFATGLLANLPEATLGTILLSVAARIFAVRDLRQIARFDRVEIALALACGLTVVLIGVLQGIVLAVALAILDRTRLSARPRDAVLGRVPGTTIWWAPAEDPTAQPAPGVLAYRLDAPLYFANANWFRSRLRAAIAAAPAPLALVVLDAGGIFDLDYTGAQALSEVLDELAARHVAFGLARATGALPDALARSGLAGRIGADHIFLSVEEAVQGLGPAPQTA